ncbi:NAD+ synthase [Lachnospiraceae bacterium RM5]|nr:NAD+ synthase [Lachnospiraceae bacterium RM5]
MDAKKEIENIVKWIRDWFEENGKNASAVIGLSGGKDSSIVATLLVKALGKERVVGVLMPNGVQSDIDDAKEIAKFLGIKAMVVNINDAFTGLTKAILNAKNPETDENIYNENVVLREDVKINIPPRLRMATLYAVAQNLENGGRVANTCNGSEDYIGYSTKYGDAAGDFSPLAHFTVNEVLQIGDELKVPYHLVHKTPSDGLSGKSDEDKIGFTYEVLDKYIRTGVCEDEEIKKKIDRMHIINLHKLKTIPSYEYDAK